MRIIALFILGFISTFFLGELISRATRRVNYTYVGVVLVILGFLVGFFVQKTFYPPLNIYLAWTLFGAGCGFIIHHALSMRYIISSKAEHRFIKRHITTFERICEIIPGAIMWITLTSPFWLSITLPYAVAYLLIVADAYWLFSSVRSAILMILGYRKMVWAKNQNWMDKLDQDFPNEWKEYHHLFALPVYKESFQVVGPAIDAITSLNYPKDKIMLVVGFEERTNPKEFHKETLEYIERVRKEIGEILVTFHPADLPGEIPGPGTNRNWMLNHSLDELKKKKIDPAKVIVTTLDVDFVVHHNFLSGMLHRYLLIPEAERMHRSLTGAFFYTNNYWQTPAPMRMIATGTALWQLAEMYGSDKYQNFSSMSINLASWEAIGGWFPNKVNDDSGFYWRAYFHYSGNYKVIAHFMPIYGDAVLDVNIVRTFQNQYLQLKRWAYGVEHIPYIVTQYFHHTEIDFWDRTDKLLFAFWGYARWGSLALFVTFGGLLIPFVNPNYKESVVAINLPIVSSWILTAAFLGLFVTIFVHEKTVPPRPQNWSLLNRMWSYLQFLLIPIVLVSISTIPAIDAQTTLMLGKHLEFRTTNKAR
jgi:hypothetical protein